MAEIAYSNSRSHVAADALAPLDRDFTGQTAYPCLDGVGREAEGRGR